MDEQAFWRLVAEYLAGLQTSGGQQNPGGDLPYDDYDLQGTIGAGPIIGAAEPFDPMGDGSIAAVTSDPTGYDTSPSSIGQQMPMQLPPGMQWIGSGPLDPNWVDVPMAPSRSMTPPPSPYFERPRFFEDGSSTLNPFGNGPSQMEIMQRSGPAQQDRMVAPRQPAGSAASLVRNLSQARPRQTAVAQPPPANPPGRKPPTGNAPAPYRGPSWDYQGFRTASGPSTATTPRNTSTSTARNVVRNTTKRF